MDEEKNNGFLKKLDATYGDIRIELHIGEPYINEVENICIPLLRRIYVMKKSTTKAAKKGYLQ